MDKVKEMLGQHGDKASSGVDKAAGTADEKTGGKHHDTIRGGADKAREAMDRRPPGGEKGDGHHGHHGS
ncbi:antitoxin [Streptomyces sp. NPDC005438]|uniref:antitoxin n=1 Tax=Streptomyces sp. NPDC005438 TaxID=3156880 RepID=UPI0033B168C7